MTVTGITYNGVALTKANSITAALEGKNEDAELWYLDGPATGANNVVVTLSGTAEFANAGAQSFTGKTVTGLHGQATAQNTGSSTSSPACNVTVSASDAWLIGWFFSRYAGTLTAGSGTFLDGTTDGLANANSNAVVSAGSPTLNATAGSATTWPGVCSIAISAATAGGASGSANPYFDRLIGGM